MRKKFYQKPAIIFFGGAIILIAVQNIPSTSDGEYDTFAQCLTEQGVKMYGAYWCPHCASQKELFGSSFDHVNYVECAIGRSGQTVECTNAGIQSYPTWEFGDDSRVTGELSLDMLAERSGCELNKDI
jgi:hypothetical protein